MRLEGLACGKEHFALFMLAASVALTGASAEPAKEWVDKVTGHKIIRISKQPNSVSLYFHQNSYTPEGDKMAISTPDGIAVIDLKTWDVSPLVEGEGLRLLFVGRKSRRVFYTEGDRNDAMRATVIYAADMDTGAAKKVAEINGGTIGSINADETLLFGMVAKTPDNLRSDGTKPGKERPKTKAGVTNYEATAPDGKPFTYAEAKEVRLNERLEARIPMEIFTIDLCTGERRVVAASRDWLNHIQFSPTDPTLIMYCHEGPWHKVDRIWTVRTDGSDNKLIHERTMNMEIAGHEFFSPDGKWIWYDLQRPRGEVFWLAGYEIATGKRRWYAVDRNEWSVHFYQPPDMTRFSGDGGDEEMVAYAPDGKWLYLFTPRDVPDVAGISAPNSEDLISPGVLESEKLVDMRRHDYRLEPNMTFTPDGKWIVFRGNLEGETHVYAVEVARSAEPK